MGKVIIPDYSGKKEKPTQFVFQADNPGLPNWEAATFKPDRYDNVVLQASKDGWDYFICWDNGCTSIAYFKGHLNSGTF